MKVFKMDYLDIPLEEMKNGDIIVCHDPQHRLKNWQAEITWCVIEHYEGCPEGKGLFWDLDDAKLYAQAL
jgi:hypothetical protein